MTQTIKNTEDYRYDAKLFKQAYKAGLEAKRAESKNRQIKYIKISCIIIISLAVMAIATWIITHPIVKYNYLPFNQTTKKFVNNDISYEPSDMSSNQFDDGFVTAQSALYADLNTGEILYEKNSYDQLPIASLSKLMTAIVALNYLHFNLNEEVVVNKNWYELEDMEWSLEFDKGDTVTVETLLNAMLISSYNDAAYILADHYELGWESYIDIMNNYSKTLGLENTSFSNPSGLDSDTGNISTVRDLYRLATIVYRNETIMNIISKSYEDLSWNTGSERIYTTNGLLNMYGNIAGKTGLTDNAGQCFLGITDDGMLTIVLNSEDRFGDTQKILSEL